MGCLLFVQVTIHWGGLTLKNKNGVMMLNDANVLASDDVRYSFHKSFGLSMEYS